MEPTPEPTDSPTETPLDNIKTPKNAREARYYYRHREEILVKQKAIREARKAARQSDPEYQSKLLEKEEKAKKRLDLENEKKRKEEEREKKRKAILEKLTKPPGT
jgi:hypothetical protein